MTKRTRVALRRIVNQRTGTLPIHDVLLHLRRSPSWPRNRYEEWKSIRAARRGHFLTLPTASVAVIIPTYRRPISLVQAVESALLQSFSDISVIIIDDGGGLPELPIDSRISSYSLGRNTRSPGVVRNVGLALSDSKYVAFLDDDNTWLPEHLETAIAELDPGFAGVYTQIAAVLADGREKWTIGQGFCRSKLRRKPLTDINGVVMRRSALKKFSRITRRSGDFPGEDWRFVYQISRTHSLKFVPKTTVKYLLNQESYFSGWKQSTLDESGPTH